MRLEFYAWHCGERSAPPDAIDGLSLAQAIRIMNTLSAALALETSIHARLVDGDGAGSEFHITPRRVIAT